MTESRRSSRRKRFAISLLAAAAAFVIVFEFLALQLQGTSAAPSVAVPGSASAKPTRAATNSSVVTRASGAATSTPASSTAGGTVTAPARSHARRSHAITTRISGSGMRAHGESDDL